MKKYILYFLTLFLTVVACDNSENTDTITLSGIVHLDGQPKEGVEVRLTGPDDQVTVSDSEGHFVFKTQIQGEYQLTLSSSITINLLQVSMERLYNIFLWESITMPILNLTDPINLVGEVNETEKTVRLSWNKYQSSDFKEYRLYSSRYDDYSENSGGRLMKTFSSANDTVINLSIESLERQYDYDEHRFRLYVANDFGVIGESKIIHITLPIDEVLAAQDLYNLELSSSYVLPLAPSQLWLQYRAIATDQENFWVMYLGIGENCSVGIHGIVYYNPESNIISKDTPIHNIQGISNYITSSSTIKSMTWGDDFLWATDGSPLLKKINTNTDKIVKTWSMPESAIAYNEGSIYCASDYYVSKIDTLSGKIETVIRTEYPISGIGIRDNEIWLVFSNRTDYYIYNKTTGELLGETASLKASIYFCFFKDELATATGSIIGLYTITDIKTN